MAALGAKRRGDLEAAAALYRAAKDMEPLLAAAAQGRPVPACRVPPPPELHPAARPPPSPPRPPPLPAAPPGGAQPQLSGAEEQLAALRRRMEPYCRAAAQAIGRGEERKARMHRRIVKQYEDAIRALQAGRAVDLSELPVPPGFQPPPAAALGSAQQDVGAEDDDGDDGDDGGDDDGGDDDDEEEMKPPPPRPPPAGAAANRDRVGGRGGSRAQQQLQFLAGRRLQLQEAALRRKQLQDLGGAMQFLRRAKAVAAIMEAARAGLPVDIAAVPEAPPCEDFALLHRGAGGPRGEEPNGRHVELLERLRLQHEMCVSSSRHFIQMGNIAETTQLELLAQECRRSAQVLQQSRAQGGPEPRSRWEQRSFSAVKTFPELSSGDLLLCIVRGINLPAPPGVAPKDLDTFVRFEFQHPSADEAQKDRTAARTGGHCPEFQESFKLRINRGHRGLRRVLQGKGIKFEVTHKGGLFKPDRLLGAAQLKLEALEKRCEVRELLEVLDGRRPTGGRLEVVVRIREPLSCPQLETRTERWLVLLPGIAPPVSKGKAPAAPPKDGNKRAVQPCLSLLSFDCERLERKLQALHRAQLPAPPALQQQHQELRQRLQALRSQLQHGGPAWRAEYVAHLERCAQHFSAAARRLGTEGHREAAKEALYKRNLVESELQKLRC